MKLTDSDGTLNIKGILTLMSLLVVFMLVAITCSSQGVLTPKKSKVMISIPEESVEIFHDLEGSIFIGNTNKGELVWTFGKYILEDRVTIVTEDFFFEVTFQNEIDIEKVDITIIPNGHTLIWIIDGEKSIQDFREHKIIKI